MYNHMKWRVFLFLKLVMLLTLIKKVKGIILNPDSDIKKMIEKSLLSAVYMSSSKSFYSNMVVYSKAIRGLKHIGANDFFE